MKNTTTATSPLTRFRDMLMLHKKQLDEDYEEIIMAAEIIASRPNYVLMDETGYYHVQSSGTLEEVVTSLHKQLEKLERIKAQKEAT